MSKRSSFGNVLNEIDWSIMYYLRRISNRLVRMRVNFLQENMIALGNYRFVS
jgi:hypothetical protein